jgi:hypothetical protein
LPTPREQTLAKKNEELGLAFQQLNEEVMNIEDRLHALTTKDDNVYRLILGADPIPQTMRRAGKGINQEAKYFTRFGRIFR